MTRPAYDPLRPPAPPFPGYRLAAAGLSDDAVAAVAEHYESLDYDGRVRFVRDVTRVPNEELARRYADGSDAGPSPALLSAAELADSLKIDQLQQAAKDAGVSAGGSKVAIATRLVEAGATGDLPVVTPDQSAADAATQTPDPQSPPPGAPDAAPAEGTATAPDATSAPQTAPEPTPGPDSPAAPADAAPAATAPATAPVATTDTTSAPEAPNNTLATPDTPAAAAVASPGTSAAPTTPAAPAAGTPTPDGGTPA